MMMTWLVLGCEGRITLSMLITVNEKQGKSRYFGKVLFVYCVLTKSSDLIALHGYSDHKICIFEVHKD